MKTLVVNAGSSSLKCQLIETDGKQCLMKVLGERLGIEGATLCIKFYNPDTEAETARINVDVAGKSVAEVLEYVFDVLESDEKSPIGALSEIEAIGNRVVSGGEYFSATTIITDEVLARIDECSALAPLHNPAAVACIRASRNRLAGTPQAAVFDTAFHQTMPQKAYMYPLPMRYYTDYHIRRYGAHGTSHRYAAQQAANLLGRPLKDLGIITCHLGNGGSITAVDHGKSVDTTMGFTPLEGLMMGTRSGSIDPAIVTYIIEQEGISTQEANSILNTKSGVLGISGLSSDMRTVLEAAENGDENCALAIDMYAYAIQKAIGSYYAVMTRTDAIVMTAGIGENSAHLRERIFERLAHMGMILDLKRNDMVSQIGTDRIVSIDDSPIKICVITTDEELRIARETAAAVEESK